MVTTGNYINVTEENKDGNRMDVFVILNEPNDKPIQKENQEIADITENIIKDYSCHKMSVEDFTNELQETLEEEPLNCTKLGVQILVIM